MSDDVKLSPAEERFLAFIAYSSTGDPSYVPVMLGTTSDELNAASSRLLELGMIAPDGVQVQ